MRQLFAKFSRVDWVSFSSCIILVALTLVPVFSDVSTTGEGRLRTAIISFGAITLSIIVLAQIYMRESDKEVTWEIVELKREIGELQTLVQSAIAVDAVHEVPAGHIRHVLEEMLSSSNEWYFRGGSARWQRESVLPNLAKIKDRPVQYKTQIISPFDDELCDKYSIYRRKSRPEDERADAKQIRFELLAFIYASVVWASRSKITPHITLLHRFSPFRLDGNSESFLITVADPKRNALRSRSGNWYHTSLLDEFEYEAGYATHLTLPPEAFDTDKGESVKRFFGDLRSINQEATRNWKDDYEEGDWDEIFSLAATRRT